MSITALGQETSGQPFTYFNVARNPQNIPVTKKTVGVQLTILKSSPTGTILYQETHSTPTNFFGEFLVTIGSGNAQVGSFDHIKWADDNYYLKVGLDIKGGSVFTVMMPTQLLHIPYALYVKSGGIPNGGEARAGFKHYVGEVYGGGVVFDTWKDDKGTEHGLVVALNDQSDSIFWSNKDTLAIGPAAQSVWNGAANVSAVITQRGHSLSAALLCKNYAGGGFHDWYLPSVSELNLLFDNRDKIKKALGKASGHLLGQYIYWTSTELSASNAFVFATYGGPTNNWVFSKYSPLHIRAIRSF